TCAIFRVVEALHAVGKGRSDPAMARAVGWLLGAQKADGGWGEHHSSCLTGRYVEHPESQAAMTAWALLALLTAGQDPRSTAVTRAARWLSSRQRPDGSWPTQAPAG